MPTSKILKRIALVLVVGGAAGLALTLVASSIVAGPRFVWEEVSDIASEASLHLARHRWTTVPGLRAAESEWNALFDTLIATHLGNHPRDAGDSGTTLVIASHPIPRYSPSLSDHRYRIVTRADIRAIVDNDGKCDYLEAWVRRFSFDSIYVDLTSNTRIAPRVDGSTPYRAVVVPTGYSYRCNRQDGAWWCSETDV